MGKTITELRSEASRLQHEANTKESVEFLEELDKTFTENPNLKSVYLECSSEYDDEGGYYIVASLSFSEEDEYAALDCYDVNETLSEYSAEATQIAFTGKQDGWEGTLTAADTKRKLA